MRVERFLEDSARRFPEQIALVAGRKRLSYGELDALAERLAGALAARGVQRGDRVVLFLDNDWQAVVVILNALPISFDYGLYQVLMAAKVGATLVLERSFAYPQLILEKMLAERVTGLPIVPTMAAILLQQEQLEGEAFAHLRYITS